MIDCKQFIDWLKSQDESSETMNKSAKEHINDCESCYHLFRVDSNLDNLLKESIQTVETPTDLIKKFRREVESKPKARVAMPGVWNWKIVAPAFVVIALVSMVVINPYVGSLRNVDDISRHALGNHMQTQMAMSFQAHEVMDAGQWFTEKLNYRVRLPNLQRLGLEMVGGRKCTLGRKKAAYVLCENKGRRASLFIINPGDLSFQITDTKRYIIEEPDYTVSIWKANEMVYTLVLSRLSPSI